MALKTFTKTSFTTCMQAFYEEIKNTKETGDPEIVLYLYNKNSVRFNPRGPMKIQKDGVLIGAEKTEVKFNIIRGLDFYFKNDSRLEPKDLKAKPLPRIDFSQFQADRIAKMKENLANETKKNEPDVGMQEYQNLLAKLGAK